MNIIPCMVRAEAKRELPGARTTFTTTRIIGVCIHGLPWLLRIRAAAALAAFGLITNAACGATVDATFNSAADIPVTANGYTAAGDTVNFTLNFAPPTGTDLTVVNNTALDFIHGTFDNLAQGQAVALSYGGTNYTFVANYYGGSGNDLVLVWTSQRLFAWGRNSDGRLGDNTTTNRLLPVPATVTGVLAGKTVVTAAAGYSHSLALCSDGTVVAWGDNSYGQLGDNGVSGVESLVPVVVNTAPGVSVLHGKIVVAVAAGGDHSLALCSDGTVAAWGDNEDGELGDNTATNRPVPVAVTTASGISALYGKAVVAIAAGCYHSLALCSDGTVTAWGWNSFGQLGNNGGGIVEGSLVPVAVNKALGVSALSGQRVVAIAGGGAHSLALCSNGTVAAWGWNDSGQLGTNIRFASGVPVAVNTTSNISALYGKAVVAIAAGCYHSLALCSDGTVVVWGDDNFGQLGDNGMSGYNTQVPLALNTNSGVSALYGKTVTAIATGWGHSLAQCSDGTVAAWGLNGYGQLGDNSSGTNRLVPVAVNVTPLAASQRLARAFSGPLAEHTLALVAAPPAQKIVLTSAQIQTNRSFQFAFTNSSGAFFGVEAATNLALSSSNWTPLTGLTEVLPGQFQFTDGQATNSPQRFYRVSSP